MARRLVLALASAALVACSHASASPEAAHPEVDVEEDGVALGVTSPAVSADHHLAASCGATTGNLSPPLAWSHAPHGARVFALVAEDPDADHGTIVHWLVWNIPASTTTFAEGVPKIETLRDGSTQGRNDFHQVGWDGPSAVEGRPHRLVFKVYALATRLDLPATATKQDLVKAMTGKVVARGELDALFGP